MACFPFPLHITFTLFIVLLNTIEGCICFCFLQFGFKHQEFAFCIVTKKKKSMSGDWICETCQHLNFVWRQKCRRCNAPVEGLNKISISTNAPCPLVCCYKRGDWFCDAGMCRAHNFASRRICYKCGAMKSVSFFGGSLGYYKLAFPSTSFGFYGQMGGRIGRRGWKPGDWFCGRRECKAHNYGSRVQCFKCNGSRELVSNVSRVST